jgi:hypothetical protein
MDCCGDDADCRLACASAAIGLADNRTPSISRWHRLPRIQRVPALISTPPPERPLRPPITAQA